MKHTPGPWTLVKDGLPELNNQNNVVYGPGGTAIVYGQANDADACLIAAAPDHHAVALQLDRLMLVIESAVRHSDPRNHAAVMLLLTANRAAIAKATGSAA